MGERTPFLRYNSKHNVMVGLETSESQWQWYLSCLIKWFLFSSVFRLVRRFCTHLSRAFGLKNYNEKKPQGEDPATTGENIKRLKKACMAKSSKKEDTKAMTVLMNKTFYKRRQMLFDDECTIEDFLETFPFLKHRGWTTFHGKCPMYDHVTLDLRMCDALCTACYTSWTNALSYLRVEAHISQRHQTFFGR